MTNRETKMAEPLRAHAQDLADYLNENILDSDELTSYDILDALASLGITLVEDLIADSTLTYYESLPKPDEES
jgi:hypothetical protein